MIKPSFLIVGAPKSGTTSMAQYLGAHPDIFMAKGEPRFFGTDIPCGRPRLSESEYLSLFSTAVDKPCRGEKSPVYLHSKLAAAEIHRFNPETKILIMLRNPIDMVYSLHGQLAFKSFREDILDFGEALNAEEDRRCGKRLPRKNWHPGVLFYSTIARYTEQIARYQLHFPAEQIHIVIFDDFISDTAAEYAKTLRFLGVADDFRPEFKIYNPAISYRFVFWRKHLLPLSNAVKKLANRTLPGLAGMAARMPQLRGIMHRKQTRRPPMQRVDRERLNKIYTNEIRSLEHLLKRDLERWLA